MIIGNDDTLLIYRKELIKMRYLVFVILIGYLFLVIAQISNIDRANEQHRDTIRTYHVSEVNQNE